MDSRRGKEANETGLNIRARTHHRHVRRWLVLAASGLGLFAAGVALSQTAGPQPAPPPVGWSAEDWARLTPEKQAEVIADEPVTEATDDPNAKLEALATNPDPGPSPDLDVLAQADGPGEEVLTGILETAQSPFLSEMYRFQNRWQELAAGGTLLLQAFAGADAQDELQGVIVVNEMPWPPREAELGVWTEYRTAERIGSLKLTGASGMVLSFVSTSGRTGTFNLNTRAFRINP